MSDVAVVVVPDGEAMVVITLYVDPVTGKFPSIYLPRDGNVDGIIIQPKYESEVVQDELDWVRNRIGPSEHK